MEFPGSVRNQRVYRLLVWVLAVAQTACSTVYPVLPPPEKHAPIKALAVVASSGPIVVELVDNPWRDESAFDQCMRSLGGAGCSGEFCGLALLVGLGVCGLVGLTSTDNALLEAQRSATALSDSIRSTVTNSLNEELRRQIIAVAQVRGTPLARDDGRVGSELADVILDVGVTRIRVSQKGAKAPIALSIIAEARVNRAEEEGEPPRDYRHLTEFFSPEEWMADSGHRLQRSLQQSILALGEHIHDYALFHYPLPDRAPQLSGFLAPTFGLAPIDPRPRGTTVTDDLVSKQVAWVEVQGLQPTFRWEAFPRPGDLSADAENMGRVSNIRYELVVATEKNLAPEKVVYRRTHIPAPQHTIELPLEPRRRYFWTVRAQFDLDGKSWFTEWANMSFPVRERLVSPSDLSYRFRTP